MFAFKYSSGFLARCHVYAHGKEIFYAHDDEGDDPDNDDGDGDGKVTMVMRSGDDDDDAHDDDFVDDGDSGDYR